MDISVWDSDEHEDEALALEAELDERERERERTEEQERARERERERGRDREATPVPTQGRDVDVNLDDAEAAPSPAAASPLRRGSSSYASFHTLSGSSSSSKLAVPSMPMAPETAPLPQHHTHARAELFDLDLDHPTTYSSLPPSPDLRGERERLERPDTLDRLDLDHPRLDLQQLDIRQLHDAFGRLEDEREREREREYHSHSHHTHSHIHIAHTSEWSHDVVRDTRESRLDRSSPKRASPRRRPSHSSVEEDEFWPARSRAPTLDGGSGLPTPPPLDVDVDRVEAMTGDPHEFALDSPTSGDGDGVERDADADADADRDPDADGDADADADADADPDADGEKAKEDDKPLGLWDLLRDEDAADRWEGWIADGKGERIANFLAVPFAVEKVTFFGALLCLDGFLYNFTILPIRATFAASRIFSRLVRGRGVGPIPPAHVQSLLRMLLLVIPAAILMVGTDASKMYHAVRGQDTIKLYVIFNALEIADRLCCAFGQDVLDTLFARDTLGMQSRGPGPRRKREHVRPVFFFSLALGYVFVHTLVFFYMLISLNVAINSYDYTLISLLISNQFVEIKGSVFKKFEKENLFQIMCADIVERFQLGLMLVIIAVRNVIEMAGSDLAFLPKSFTRGKSLLERILSPVLFVLASEMLVDWLKHAFIAKFNHVRATVYDRFTDVLAKDVLLAGTIGSGRGHRQKRKHAILLDQSPLVARRLGIASVPLAVLVIRISAQVVGMLASSTHSIDEDALPSSDWIWTALKWTVGILVGAAGWACLVAIKILLGLGLLSFSALRQAGMDEREAEDVVNDFGRPGVGESKEEMAYNKETKRYLSNPDDDLPDHSSPAAAAAAARREYETPTTPRPRQPGLGMDGPAPQPQPQTNPKKKTWRLEEVERWTMVKRIW